MEMAGLKTVILSVVIGEGGSGGALGIGVADRLLMLENAYYSVISPEGCASILWKDSGKWEEAANSLKLTADELFKMGIIDEIIPEPMEGAHKDHPQMVYNLGKSLANHLNELLAIPENEILNKRYEKLRKPGVFTIKR